MIILLIFGGYYLLLGFYLFESVLLGSMAPVFIPMVLKGKKIKEKYLEEYEYQMN